MDDDIGAFWDMEDGGSWSSPVEFVQTTGWDIPDILGSVKTVAQGITDLAGAYYGFEQQSAQLQTAQLGSQLQRDVAVTQATAAADIARYNALAAVNTAKSAAGVAPATPGTVVLAGKPVATDKLMLIIAAAGLFIGFMQWRGA